MTTITKEQLAKLPVWAQKHIEALESERFVSVRSLNEFTDSTTKSPFFHEDNVCTGEQTGPCVKRAYIQARRLSVNHAGVELEVFVTDDEMIGLRFCSSKRHTATVGIVVEGRGHISLMTPGNMRI